MAKRQAFADKIKKKEVPGTICPVCETPYTFLKKVTSYYSESTKSWKYGTQNLKVCKCNEKEVYA